MEMHDWYPNVACSFHSLALMFWEQSTLPAPSQRTLDLWMKTQTHTCYSNSTCLIGSISGQLQSTAASMSFLILPAQLPNLPSGEVAYGLSSQDLT